MQHPVLVHDAQSREDFLKQRINGFFLEDARPFEGASNQHELLQRSAIEQVHDHVDGFVLTEKVEHPHHRGVRNLRQCASFFEKAFQSQPVQ